MASEVSQTARLAATPVGGRIVVRRRALPNGRAVVGALLLVVAGVGSFAVANHKAHGDASPYVILSHSVTAGTRLTASDLTVRAMSLDPAVAENAFTDPARVSGSVTLAPLAAGQLLQRAEVLSGSNGAGAARPPGHELTIPVPTDRVPNGLRRGEVVAVLATYGTGNDARTIVTVQHATVLAIGEPGDSLTARGATRLTFALSAPDDVVETAHAAQVAELTIVRATLADADLPAAYSIDTKAKVSTGATPTTSTTARAGS